MEQPRSQVCAMKLLDSIAVVSTATIAVLLVVSKAAHAEEYQCSGPWGEIKIPCKVLGKGKTVMTGGFQAAPIFEMQSAGKAVNHRGDVIEIIKGPGYTLFFNEKSGSSLRIYGFAYK